MAPKTEFLYPGMFVLRMAALSPGLGQVEHFEPRNGEHIGEQSCHPVPAPFGVTRLSFLMSKNGQRRPGIHLDVA